MVSKSYKTSLCNLWGQLKLLERCLCLFLGDCSSTGALHNAVSASLSPDVAMAQVIVKWQSLPLVNGVGVLFLTFNISGSVIGVLRSLLDLILSHRHW